jgi:outer membrane protein OmpA-like peptidoglycan-associated protein
LLVALLLALGDAHAQDQSLDFELFRPVADGFGYVSVPSAGTLARYHVVISTWWSYENDPIVLSLDDRRVVPAREPMAGNDNGEGVVDDRLLANVQLAMGLTEAFSLSLDLPLVAWQDGYDVDTIYDPAPPKALLEEGVGDLRIQPKWVAIDREPVGLALVVPFALPTGGVNDYLGEDGVSVAPLAIVELADGSVSQRDYVVRIALTGGYHWRPNDRIRDLEVGDGALFGAALGFHPVDPLEIDVDFHGEAYDTAQAAAELNAGVRLLVAKAIGFTVGGGFGALPGIGAPDFRIVTGLSVAPFLDPRDRDRDGDGLPNGRDRCPREREDGDLFEDRDGCPDWDNDRDAVTDDHDPCPNEAEDPDGFQDGDGCPDRDNDGDGVTDPADRCPSEPEYSNGWSDGDGCPDAPPQPHAIEVVETGRVRVDQGALRIDDKIFFEPDRAAVARESFQLLDEIARVIGRHPELVRLRIEGHTDAVGEDSSNLALSQARAEAVRAALVERGIEDRRLEALGLGETRPIDSNETAAGRANNRRVEIVIVERTP